MRQIPLLRAAHLNGYLSVLRAQGQPIWTGLQRAGLPGTVEETPDLYLAMPRVLDCVAATDGARGAMEFGFRAAQRATLGGLRPEYQTALLSAPSGLARLQAFFRHGRQEDTGVRTGFRIEGQSMRVICESPGFEHHPGLVCTEWMNLIAIVEIIRSLTGPSWQPREITLISRLPAHDAARETFPNTRILPASPRTSILVPRAVLARPSPILSPTNDPAAEPGQSADACEAAPLDPLHMLREIVKPYLRDTPLKLSEMAELLGTSERTLQRQLGALGTSYSRLVAEARYQVACDLLAGEDMTITDVAMCLGYQNPTHFSRAFRQLAGLSPTAYRASLHAPA